jgi:eukaryotic-like serine/threonine-protein kinase
MRFPELSEYQFEGLLYEDPFGWTFVAVRDGMRCFVKVYKAQGTSEHHLKRWAKILGDSGEIPSNLSPVLEFSAQERDRLSLCVQPFYGWKVRDSGQWQVSSLANLASMLLEEQAREVILEMATCLASVHESGLFHGGLRPQEIFLTGDSARGQFVKISGFGQIFMGGLQHLEAGDYLFYTSPEQLASGDFSRDQGKRWDVYAFGVIVFELLTGHLPRLDRLRRQCEEHPEWLASAPAIAFGELTTITEHFLGQLDGEQSIEWPPGSEDLEAGLCEIVERCLSMDAAQRPGSMTEVVELLLSRPEVVESAPVDPTPSKGDLAVGENKGRNLPALVTAPDPFFEEISGDHRKHIRHWVTEVRENPVVRWQTIAIAAMVVILPLSVFGVFSVIEMKKVEAEKANEFTDLAKEAEARVNRAALAYMNQKKTLQKTSEQLKSELDQSEDSKSRLVGEAKLARQVLRQAQESGDRFFELVLENRDSDVPEFREGRGKVLQEGRTHFERLVEVYGDAPDFIVSTANAHFFLGQIYREMGEFGKALASFGEAERRYSALLEDTGSTSADFVKNIAVAKNSLGRLAIKSSQYSVARHYFTESSRFWTEYRSRVPEAAATAAVNIHANSLDIAECEFAMGRDDAALDAGVSIGVRLAEQQKETPEDHRVVGLLARSFSMSGRVLESRRENDLARSAYQQSADLYALAVTLDAAVDEYQLGLGNSLARLGLLSGDFKKLEGAADVLGRVVASNPYESTYLKTLADIYGALSQHQRDGGELKNAIALEEKAIAILKPIIETNRSVAPDVRFSYSERLSHLAEMLGDSGKFDQSREPLREAITLLEGITNSGNSVAEYHRALARARGLVGFACIKAGDNSEAKEHLQLAKTEWESFINSNPDDSDAAQGVQWTSEQLKSIQ